MSKQDRRDGEQAKDAERVQLLAVDRDADAIGFHRYGNNWAYPC